MGTTLYHVTIVTDAFDAARPVYDAILGALGLRPSVDYGDPEQDSHDTGTVAAVGYADAGKQPVLWLVAGPVPTTGAHLALGVSDRAIVQAAADTAAASGARVIQPPREWESAQLNYYGAQFADPAGNLIEVVFRG